MSNEEFYNTYIKDDRTEDEKMLDTIHEQAQNIRMNELMDKQIRQMDKEKREKRNNKIATILSIAILVGLLATNYYISKKGVESCVAGGHSESWCVVNG